MDAATVRRQKDGSYRATTPKLDLVCGEGGTRKDALADLWEWCRWLLVDPMRMTFEAEGNTYTAEVRAERQGGYSVAVPELPGCFTCWDTMEEVRANVVEAADEKSPWFFPWSPNASGSGRILNMLLDLGLAGR